ncbi:hypothetical protein ACIBEF_11015 [Micromonospora sp. NPDC050795]|uniref:hypothetical protein n=1 Tax=Micromonospora sp. NPDC050795 TaxID=3364282 RepID=UPI0037B4E97D
MHGGASYDTGSGFAAAGADGAPPAAVATAVVTATTITAIMAAKKALWVWTDLVGRGPGGPLGSSWLMPSSRD